MNSGTVSVKIKIEILMKSKRTISGDYTTGVPTSTPDIDKIGIGMKKLRTALTKGEAINLFNVSVFDYAHRDFPAPLRFGLDTDEDLDYRSVIAGYTLSDSQGMLVSLAEAEVINPVDSEIDRINKESV